MKLNRQLTALSSLAVFACLAGSPSRAAAQSFHVTDLGALPHKKMSSAAALNNAPQVAGTSFSDGSDQSAFVYSVEKGQMDPLDEAGGGMVSRAFGINDAGAVVGDSDFGGAAFGPSTFSHAALFANGTCYDLGSLKPGEYSRANSINAAGQVVGFSGPKPDGANSRAFYWSAESGMVDLGTLGGDYAYAMSINDSGYVTGTSEIIGKSLGTSRAFIAPTGPATMTREMRDLGTLGGDSSFGTYINAKNHVVGYSENNDGRIHAFLHAGIKMEDLGSLGGKHPLSDRSFALGVNSHDQVVGYSYLPLAEAGPLAQPQPVAFIYQNGRMVDLNEMIGAAAKSYRLVTATAINEAGQITAMAVEYDSNIMHALLLTPEPTASIGILPVSVKPPAQIDPPLYDAARRR